MSMEHKAFIFDTKSYSEELNDILLTSGLSNDIRRISQFIADNIDDIRSPYSGDELEDDWEDELGTKDIQEYADFALAAYYDPGDDIGLSYYWDPLIEILKDLDFDKAEYCILGTPIQKEHFCVDPGRCGLGLARSEDIPNLLKQLIAIQPRLEQLDEGDLVDTYNIEMNDLITAYEDLLSIYQSASNDNEGVMFTF